MNKIKSVLCLGDSNTWGYNPQTDFRYSREERWTGRLNSIFPEMNVSEAGIPEMTFSWQCPGLTARSAMDSAYAFLTAAMPVDLVTVCLGTNDTKIFYDATAEKIARQAVKLIRLLKSHEWAENAGLKILLINPVPMNMTAAEVLADSFSQKSVEESAMLAKHLKEAAYEESVFFADASDWNVELAEDGCHYTKEGHETFAQHVAKELVRIEKEG